MNDILANRYEVTGPLGRGGMGVVVRAVDRLLGREVAVKLVPPHQLSDEARERFLREAQVVARMDHPGIVPVFDLGESEGAVFFVMPVVAGTTLRKLFERGRMPVDRAAEIGARIADALEYSHSRGVIHRDVKPENVMVEEDGGELRVRVMDFGLARTDTDQRLTATGTLMGTVAYLSPEQARGEAVDRRRDNNSLAAVLYEALAGAPPFTGPIPVVLADIVRREPVSLRAAGVAVDESLDALLLSALAKDPTRRPDRAAAFAGALRRCATGGGAAPPPPREARTTGLPRLFGRDAECDEIDRRLARLEGGESQTLLIGGETGVGKSRLLEEIGERARARGVRVLRGRFHDGEGGLPWQGFGEILVEGLAAPAPSRPPLDDLAADLVALFPPLADLLGSDAAPASPTGIGADRARVADLVARALARIAAGRPLVLLLEGLGAAGASTEALGALLPRLATPPVLVAGTFRSSEVDRGHPLRRLAEGLRDDPGFARLELGPLPAAPLAAMVSELLGAPVSGSLAERVREATDGNPLFARELVRALADGGSLTRDDTGAVDLAPGRDLDRGELPATISQAVERRIDRLPEGARELAAVASILGRSFDAEELAAIAPDPARIDDGLDRLVAAGLLAEAPGGRGDRFRFTSGVIRDVLAASIPARRRRSLHRRAGEALEARAAGRVARHAPALLHHFAQGDDAARAVTYGVLAARAALEARSPSEAVRAAKTALEFADDRDDAEPAAVAEARWLLGTALRSLGQAEAAVREFTLAARAAEGAGETPRQLVASLAAAETAWEGRRPDEARRLVDEALPVARRAGAAEILERLLLLGATLASLRGEPQEARSFAEEAEALEGSGAERSPAPRRGRLRVPVAGRLASLDPARSIFVWQSEIIPAVYETLTRQTGTARIVPGLAESFELLDGGRRTRFRLRAGVRFHDGRPLTADDVADSLRRLLGDARSESRLLLAPIRGASRRIETGDGEVDGIRVVSALEVDLLLDEPVAFLPALMAVPATAIVPAGTPVSTDDAAAHPPGTGPFRVARFEPGVRLELEAFDGYWREGRPGAERLTFDFGVPGSEALSGLLDSRYDLVDLPPAEADQLRRDPTAAARELSAPTLSTYYAVFNIHAGPFADEAARRAAAAALDPAPIVRRRLGARAVPARTLIPPGLGAVPPPPRSTVTITSGATASPNTSVEIAVLRLPVYADTFSTLTDDLVDRLRAAGFRPRIVELDGDYRRLISEQRIDILLARWIADIPDPDTFTHRLLHSRTGILAPFCGSPETDRTLDETRGETDPARRRDLFAAIERTVRDRALLVPLFHEQGSRFVRPGLAGVRLGLASAAVEWDRLRDEG